MKTIRTVYITAKESDKQEFQVSNSLPSKAQLDAFLGTVREGYLRERRGRVDPTRIDLRKNKLLERMKTSDPIWQKDPTESVLHAPKWSVREGEENSLLSDLKLGDPARGNVILTFKFKG